jgi:trehalose/maltose transport system permease protein
MSDPERGPRSSLGFPYKTRETAMSTAQSAVDASALPGASSKPLKEHAPSTSWGKARERLGWMMVAPAVILVLVVALYPLVQTIRLSFTNTRIGRPGAKYVGFDNYRYLWHDQQFIDSIKHTFEFTFASVALETVFGMVVALVIHSNFKGRGVVRTSMLVPWAIPTVVSAQMWKWMYNDVYGVFNDFLVGRTSLLSHAQSFTTNPSTSLWSIIAVDVWKTTPFMALLLLAGLQVIPGDIYEASMIDGASKWQQYWQMTVPLLKPALLVALIFRTLDSFRVFDVVYVMTKYEPSTMTMAVYAQQTIFGVQRIGRGSAASVVIFLLIAALVVVYTRIVKVEEQ